MEVRHDMKILSRDVIYILLILLGVFAWLSFPTGTIKEGYIYLATPYSHEDPKIMHDRFVINSTVAGKLFKKGVVVFAPIVQGVPMEEFGDVGGTDWKTWENFDKVMIANAEAVYVLLLPGWAVSKGVTAEIKYAKSLDIPVYYLDPDTLQASPHAPKCNVFCIRGR